jgi:uncharacterized delta-60 repeat protein
MRARPSVLVLVASLSTVLAADRAGAAGTLDASFGTAGLAQAPYGEAADVARQSDGKLITLASSAPFGAFSFRVSRFEADGAPDATFGSGGSFEFPLGSAVGVHPADLLVDANDRIAVVGAYYSGEDQDQIMVVRLTPEGALDGGFGSGGLVVLHPGTDPARGSALAEQADGKLVVGGYAATPLNSNRDFLIARLDDAGELDASFGVAGMVRSDLSGFDDGLSALIVMPDDDILAIGSTVVGPGATGLALVRYEASGGALAADFGTGGVTTTPVPGHLDAWGLAGTLDPEGGTIVAGAAPPDLPVNAWENDLVVARYDAAGSLDASFGSKGLAVERIDVGFTPSRVMRRADGRIVLAGNAIVSADDIPGCIPVGVPTCIDVQRDFALVQLDADGDLDDDFGSDGAIRTDLGGDEDAIAGAIMTADEKVVAVGTSPTNLILARYCPSSCPGGIQCRDPDRARVALGPEGTVKWAWRHGGATPLGDFGDPTASTGFLLEAFAELESNGDATPIASLAIAGGGTCGARPCWRATETGFVFADGTQSQDGVARIQIKVTPRTTKLGLTASGPSGPEVLTPLTPPVLVRLRRADAGECWQANFPRASRNDPTRYAARAR